MLNAWRDFQAKVSGFVEARQDCLNMLFERPAVTPMQIIEMDLPTRLTKQSDSRARDFIGESVEVDAIPPSVLRKIAEKAIMQHIDEDVWRLTRIAEDGERRLLSVMAADTAKKGEEEDPMDCFRRSFGRALGLGDDAP